MAEPDTGNHRRGGITESGETARDRSNDKGQRYADRLPDGP